jgi:O-antigen chain-terminating methyltransferase
MTDQGHDRPGNDDSTGFRPLWVKTLFSWTPWGIWRKIRQLSDDIGSATDRIDSIERRLDSIEGHLPRTDARLDMIEDSIRTIQSDFQALRDHRVTGIEERVDRAEIKIGAVESEAERLRDRVVPAVVDRGNALIDRTAENLEELASLVERILIAEPLPAPSAASARQIAGALSSVQPKLLAAFRGTEEEIRHRLDHHLAVLLGTPPVIDLGCGRGELLLLLREAGAEARGIEGDPALAQAARRRGLDVIEGDVTTTIRAQPDEAFGAVTAIHLLEHLPPNEVLELLQQARRVLRPGGLFLAECPNPHSLRVGASLYWRDPTHLPPLLPETLELYFKASGFDVRGVEYLHPFPDEEKLSSDLGETPSDTPQGIAEMHQRLVGLVRRLDALLSGPRDFVILADKT